MKHTDFDQIDRDQIEYPVNIATRYFHDMINNAANLSEEEERAVIDQARNGEHQARERLILSCLFYVFHMAKNLSQIMYHPHDELLDLIAIGNYALVERLDVALTKKYPRTYLMGYAKRRMLGHCLYRASLITVPETTGNSEKVQHVASLDTLMDGEAFDVPAPESPDQASEHYADLHGPLYEALGTLKPRFQEVLIRHYGLYDQPTESLGDISATWHPHQPARTVARSVHERAINRLRKWFAQKR